MDNQKKNEFVYDPLVVIGKQTAMQGKDALAQWLQSLNKKDREFIEPYMALFRAITKEAEKGLRK